MLLKVICLVLILQIIDIYGNDQFVIKNKKTGLVLDASKKYIWVNHWNKKNTQLWNLQPFGTTGRYIIRNVGNGKVLDACPNKRLTTWRNKKGKNQQWILKADGYGSTIKVWRFPNRFLVLKKGAVKLLPFRQNDGSDTWLLVNPD